MKPYLSELGNRLPAVAGSFYPSNPETLKAEIADHFEYIEKHKQLDYSKKRDVSALIVPHAGYVFSGNVAASAYMLLKSHKNIERVFLIGSSHHCFFDYASVYYDGQYITPLGNIPVDTDIARHLINNYHEFDFLAEAHMKEHSLEVQLPFLQTVLNTKFKIVPIILGTHKHTLCEQIAKCLKPYFTPYNLFVISTDLSHYPAYHDAMKLDRLTADVICKNNPDEFIKYMEENSYKKIPDLSTCICGWTSVLTLLYMTAKDNDIHYHPIMYQNSGEIPLYGDKTRVVGYQSICIYKN